VVRRQADQPLHDLASALIGGPRRIALALTKGDKAEALR
jgi:hypothetical protein